MPSAVLERGPQTPQEKERESRVVAQERIQKGLRELFDQTKNHVLAGFKRFNNIQQTIDRINANGDVPPTTLLDLQEKNIHFTRRLVIEANILFDTMSKNGIEPEETDRLRDILVESAPKNLNLKPTAPLFSETEEDTPIGEQQAPPQSPEAAPTTETPETAQSSINAPQPEATPAEPSQPEPAPIQTETAAQTEDRESFKSLQKHVIDNWDKQIDNEVMDQLRKIAPALSEAAIMSTGMENSLPPEVFAIIQQAHQLADQAESATSGTELDAVLEQRNALMKQFVEGTESTETTALIRSIAEQHLNNKFKEHLISTWEEQLDKDIFDIMNKVSKKFAEETLTKDLPATSRDLIQQAQLLSKEIGAAPNEEAVNEILRKRNDLLEQLASTIQLPANPQMWDKQTSKVALDVLQRFYPTVNEDNFANFVSYTLHKDIFKLIRKMHALGDSIDYSKPEAVEKALKQRQIIIAKLEIRINEPDHGMRPKSEKTEKETFAPVSAEDVRAEIAKRETESLKQKSETYFNKFDQLYGDFQRVAGKAGFDESRKKLDELFVDFIQYEQGNPEEIPEMAKKALLDAILDVYKTVNKQEFSYENFNKLSPQQRESMGAHTVNAIAGHLKIRDYMIEQTSLPPVKPASKPKIKVTPKPVEAKPQPAPQPSTETQPTKVPTPEVKPVEATVEAKLSERAETPTNPELLKILDTLRETTGLTTLDQPEIKQLYKLFQTQGDPKTWHQEIKDEVMSLARAYTEAAGDNSAEKLLLNSKVLALVDLDADSWMEKQGQIAPQKGIDKRFIAQLQNREKELHSPLTDNERKLRGSLTKLAEILGVIEQAKPPSLSMSDMEEFAARLNLSKQTEGQETPQTEQAEDILNKLNTGNLTAASARSQLAELKTIEGVAQKLLGSKFKQQELSIPDQEARVNYANQVLKYNTTRQKRSEKPTKKAVVTEQQKTAEPTSFARKVAEQIIQTERIEPQEAKAKTILKPDKAKIKATAENPFKVYRELVKNIAQEIAGGRDADEALERAIDDYLRNPIRATRKEDLKKRLLAETRIMDAMAAKSQTS